MFNFMKKGVGVSERDREKSDRDEKEKRKREKKLRKEAKNSANTSGGSGVSGSMSTEELLRLDEVRRSLKIRGRRKEKEKLPSGITADYSEFFAHLDIDRPESNNSGGGIELDRGNEEITAAAIIIDRNFGTPISQHQSPTINNYNHGNNMPGIPQSDSSETSLHSANNTKSNYVPPIPPKPPKRGILKGSRSSISNINEEVVTATSPDSRVVLIRNTLQNELLFEQGNNPSFTSAESLRSDGGMDGIMMQGVSISVQQHSQRGHSSFNNLHIMTSPSPSAESLTDTTNSSFATPPFSLSPIGESQGIYRWSRVQAFEEMILPLPPIKLVKLPSPRELTIKRQKPPRTDFGFSLRKAMCLDRTDSLMTPICKPVIFAEPGAGVTGLLPGDKLLKVNGIPVSDLTREHVIELIKSSGDTVRVEVQPIPELVELSRRCLPHSAESTEDVDKQTAFNCNTLKRSASKRFKHDVSTNNKYIL